jgi:hypothetical protein
MTAIRPLLWVALALTLSLLTPIPAAAQAEWYDGGIQYSSVTNCFSIIQSNPYQEPGAGTFVGFVANPKATQPAPNQTYYIHVYIAGLGNPCSGTRFYVDVALPSSTTLAITGTTPVYCLANGVAVSAAECPQSLPPSSLNPGAFAIYSNDNAHANLWPLPQGNNWEFQIPVRSSTTLSGATLQANVRVLDGNSSPWLRPQQGVYVFSNTPTIIYRSPSTINIETTTARSEAYLYTNNASLTGTIYFDIGPTASYGFTDSGPLNGGDTAYLAWAQWGPPPLLPDTLYHWRFRFTTTAGATYVGGDQTFRTKPDGKVTIGTGSAGSCTEAAFASAFSTAGTKQIVFDCGAVAKTIVITSTRTVSSAAFTTLLIDGGNKVTFERQGTGHHFNVTGGALTLKGITLSNGFNQSTCGGSVNVSSGAQLILDEARFVNNQSYYDGGAVCNFGTTTVSNALFSGNASQFTHGGAIGNYGGAATVSVTNTRFLNNSSSINGGAIDNVGALTVTGSTFAGNAAGFRGGGINSYVGTMNISSSSFLTNTAGLYGGGVASDASTTTITGSTFAANSSNNHGGGLEMSGDGSLTLTNSTLTDNTAVTEGGGVYWTAGGTATLTLLNNTIADNTAGTTGGNIYNGTSGAHNTLISLKNSIIAGGSPNNCSGTMVSSGFNLNSENSKNCGLGAAGDKVGVDPNLGPLLKNGGTTSTRLPQPGSQAIDGGTNTGCPSTDQQGLPRLIDGDGNGSQLCDIGATEVSYPRPTITRISPDGGPTAGGQVVTITGTNLSGVSSVELSGASAAVNGTTATTATFVTPAHAAGEVTVVAISFFGSGSAPAGYTYYPLIGPSTLTAAATSSSVVALSWPASSGAASYEVWRSSQNGQFSLVLSTASTSVNDTGLTANTTYLYRVRAIAGANTSAFSLTDAATTTVFTDTSLAGIAIKVVHVTELRTAINAMRVAAGLDATVFTNPTLSAGSTAVKRVHLVELRAALDAARSTLGLVALVYTNATITARSTVISASHLTELRAGTQ